MIDLRCVNLALYGELSSLLTVKTLTGMTTDVYPRENCLDFVFVFFYPISEIGHCRHACRETPS